MVDGHVVRQPWPRQAGRHVATDGTERLVEERRRLLLRSEGPEAVDHANLVPATQERAIAPAEQSVLRQVATQARNVVTTVVEQDEQASITSEDAGHGG